MSRKYENYEIKVTYKNGDTEVISMNGINTSNYNDMLEVYRNVKKQYENDIKVSTIDFIGKNSNGEMKIFFSKAIKVVAGNKDLLIDCRDITFEIVERIKLLKEQRKYHENMINKATKKTDSLLHMVENNHNNKFDSKESELEFKVDIFEAIEETYRARRYSKQQLSDLDNIIKQLENININGYGKKRKPFTMNSNEYKNKVELELSYKDDIEKVKLINKYSKKYDKYIDDPANNILYFYNNVGSYNKNKKLAM